MCLDINHDIDAIVSSFTLHKLRRVARVTKCSYLTLGALNLVFMLAIITQTIVTKR
jgi:hypothetical protein